MTSQSLFDPATTWILTGPPLLFLSGAIPVASPAWVDMGHGAGRDGWEVKWQPGWHEDWRSANCSQAGRDPCQLCLHLSLPLWTSGRHARWHSKFATHSRDSLLFFLLLYLSPLQWRISYSTTVVIRCGSHCVSVCVCVCMCVWVCLCLFLAV